MQGSVIGLRQDLFGQNRDKKSRFWPKISRCRTKSSEGRGFSKSPFGDFEASQTRALILGYFWPKSPILAKNELKKCAGHLDLCF